MEIDEPRADLERMKETIRVAQRLGIMAFDNTGEHERAPHEFPTPQGREFGA